MKKGDKLPAILIDADFMQRPRNRLWIAEQGSDAVLILFSVWLACAAETKGKIKKSEAYNIAFPVSVPVEKIKEILKSAACPTVGLLDEEGDYFFNSRILEAKKNWEKKKLNYSIGRKKLKENKKLSRVNLEQIQDKSSLNYNNNIYNNNINNNIKKEEKKKLKFFEKVWLSSEEHEALKKDFGEAKTAALIQKLENFKQSSGKTYKSDYHAILNWVVDAVKPGTNGLEQEISPALQRVFDIKNKQKEEKQKHEKRKS